MSLSTQVKESVNEACKNVRDALAFASRSERPVVLGILTDTLVRLESLDSINEFTEAFSNKNKD
jgi:hypothetical protein